MKKIVVLFSFIIIFAAISFILFFRSNDFQKYLTSFRQTQMPDEKIIERIPRPDKNLHINVDSPKNDQLISSPVIISGKAHREWYGGFGIHVTLKDKHGAILGEAMGKATQENSANTLPEDDLIPFSSRLDFTVPPENEPLKAGILVFSRTLPSGDPFDDFFSVRVRLSGSPDNEGECRPTGCSGQICSDEEIVTTCEYRDVYECYILTVCERQEDGKCGWTSNGDFLSCLNAL